MAEQILFFVRVDFYVSFAAFNLLISHSKDVPFCESLVSAFALVCINDFFVIVVINHSSL